MLFEQVGTIIAAPDAHGAFLGLRNSAEIEIRHTNCVAFSTEY